mmetsp:Transcript_25764/g.46663  ORF Transcript_25764/g.46663 Transcript_25764/m.46663 type:complete len:94 (-) Transcript_25764:107-388(-)
MASRIGAERAEAASLGGARAALGPMPTAAAGQRAPAGRSHVPDVTKKKVLAGSSRECEKYFPQYYLAKRPMLLKASSLFHYGSVLEPQLFHVI